MKGSLYKKVDVEQACKNVPGYGQDTSVMLYYLEECKRIGIDHSTLYHYRNQQGSVSYNYTPSRFKANVGCISVIRRFLENNHAFTPSTQKWLRGVYLPLLIGTVDALANTGMIFEDKIKECRKMISHPATVEALKQPSWESENLGLSIGKILQQFPINEKIFSFEEIEQILSSIAPNCGPAVTENIFPLLIKEEPLFHALLRNRRNEAAQILLSFIAKGRYVKQYDLGVALQALSGADSLLNGINNTSFIRKYEDVYWKIWIGELEDALDLMTGLILEDKVKGEKKTFLQLYLSVAALQNEGSAFLFGNIKLAELYLEQQ